MNLYKHRVIFHHFDFCVIGGGLAGLFAAVQAAREGLKVALIQDRPVLGGNASSEIRMWPLGCRGLDYGETGLFEEVLCENMYRNPYRNYSIWDSVLYGLAIQEDNLTLFLNTSCLDANMKDSNTIELITAWQLTTYTIHQVYADYFADCSGDSILAPLIGAKYRKGRESSQEFNESFGPKYRDRRTMGSTCMMQAIEKNFEVDFIPPTWAEEFSDEIPFQHRDHHMSDKLFNYWWLELGGDLDTIHDAELIREDLVKIGFGTWDHIKNHGDHGADNWELSWFGFLPGKRESRRYEGAYILSEKDILAEGKFKDIIAYGGWPMDDHDPSGFSSCSEPNINHQAPAPYGIPYRVLYSNEFSNLWFAGRNISVTHAALSSTRVMATCAIMGQAVGMAAALAHKYAATSKDIYTDHIEELKDKLMYADCYLPFNKRSISELTSAATLETTSEDKENLENIRNGIDRSLAAKDNGFYVDLGESIIYHFKQPKYISEVRIIFDSDLHRSTIDGHKDMREKPMLCNIDANFEGFNFPRSMTKAYKIEIMDQAKNWLDFLDIKNNYQRRRLHTINSKALAIRFTPIETWGSEQSHIFAIDIN